MKEVLYILIVFTVFVLTNPDTATHKAKVKERVIEKIKAQMDVHSEIAAPTNEAEVVDAIQASITDNMVSKAVKVDNFFAFSLTRINTESENTVIGLGILGKVYLFGNF
jgi:hypothetical protein